MVIGCKKSEGAAQSGWFHCSIQAEPLLNFASRDDFAERHMQDFSHRFKEGVRLIRVEDLVAGHHCDQIFSIAEVDDAVRPAEDHVDRLNRIAGDFKLYGLSGGNVPLPDQPVPVHDDELFPFGVVPVLPLGNAGP